MGKFISTHKAAIQHNVAYLGRINSSAKLIKNGKISQQYTYGIYLAPASQSGYNVCSHSTEECRVGCLSTSGRAGMEIKAGKSKTINSRVAKTRLFYQDNKYFMEWLITDIIAAQKIATKDGFGISARLNCTSDINWNSVKYNGNTIFELFPEVQFYDYTKNPAKFVNKPTNYHLTFSYTGKNGAKAKALLQQGFNVAVVFNVAKGKSLPQTFGGFKVIDGDLTDYRPNDEQGVIVGLRFKEIANKRNAEYVKQSIFVVNPNSTSPEMELSNVLETSN